jgi:hypothetical protein
MEVTPTYPASGTTGGRVLQAAAGEVHLVFPENLPFQPDRVYRIRAKVRMTASGGGSNDLVDVGVVGIAGDGTTVVDVTGGTSYITQHAVCAHDHDFGDETLNEWVILDGFFAMNASDGGTAPNTANEPAAMEAGVRYFRPYFRLNHASGSGTMQIDFLSIEYLLDPPEIDFLTTVSGYVVVSNAIATGAILGSITAGKTTLVGISSESGVIRTPLMAAFKFHSQGEPKLEWLWSIEEMTHAGFLLVPSDPEDQVLARVGTSSLFKSLPSIVIVEREIRDDQIVAVEIIDSESNPNFAVLPIPAWNPTAMGQVMDTADPSAPLRQLLHGGSPYMIDVDLSDHNDDWIFDISYSAGGATASVLFLVYVDGARVARVVREAKSGFFEIYDTALGTGEVLTVEVTPFDLDAVAGIKGDTVIKTIRREESSEVVVSAAEAERTAAGSCPSDTAMQVTVTHTEVNTDGGDTVDILESVDNAEFEAVATGISPGTGTETVLSITGREFDNQGITEQRRYMVRLRDGDASILHEYITGEVDTSYAACGASGGGGSAESGGASSASLSSASASRSNDGDCASATAIKVTVTHSAANLEGGEKVSIDEKIGSGSYSQVRSGMSPGASYTRSISGREYNAGGTGETRTYRVRLLSSSGEVLDTATDSVSVSYDACGGDPPAISAGASRIDNGVCSQGSSWPMENKVTWSSANAPAGASVGVQYSINGGSYLTLASNQGVSGTKTHRFSSKYWDSGGITYRIKYKVILRDSTGATLVTDTTGSVNNDYLNCTGGGFEEPV